MDAHMPCGDGAAVESMDGHKRVEAARVRDGGTSPRELPLGHSRQVVVEGTSGSGSLVMLLAALAIAPKPPPTMEWKATVPWESAEGCATWSPKAVAAVVTEMVGFGWTAPCASVFGCAATCEILERPSLPFLWPSFYPIRSSIRRLGAASEISVSALQCPPRSRPQWHSFLRDSKPCRTEPISLE